MKICVIGGGGAIGGYLAVMLARAGNDVTVVARGATLAAINERGLALIMDDQPEPLVAQVKAVEKKAKKLLNDIELMLRINAGDNEVYLKITEIKKEIKNYFSYLKL